MDDKVVRSEKESVCNVFKNEDRSITKETFMQRWVELINNMEKDKQYHTM